MQLSAMAKMKYLAYGNSFSSRLKHAVTPLQKLSKKVVHHKARQCWKRTESRSGGGKKKKRVQLQHPAKASRRYSTLSFALATQ